MASSEDLAVELLKGRTIVNVRYMTPEEAERMGWNKRPVILELDNDTNLFPSRDDEGNDGGSMFVNTMDGKNVTLPGLR